jgi:neutral ceramidase
MIGGFLSKPDHKQKQCQAPKPILLNTGRVSLPYEWDPKAVPISVFRVGNVFILNVPAELTTMAGRRLRKSIRNLLVHKGVEDPLVTVAGLANSYTHYITTFEEYGGQRYEAASTLYGPHTLNGYIQEFQRITTDLMDGTATKSDAPPDDMGKKQLSLIPPVALDTIGFGLKVSLH